MNDDPARFLAELVKGTLPILRHIDFPKIADTLEAAANEVLARSTSVQGAEPVDMRTTFENWFSDDGANPRAIERDSSGEYKLMSTVSAWQTWKACSAAQGIASRNDGPDLTVMKIPDGHPIGNAFEQLCAAWHREPCGDTLAAICTAILFLRPIFDAALVDDIAIMQQANALLPDSTEEGIWAGDINGIIQFAQHFIALGKSRAGSPVAHGAEQTLLEAAKDFAQAYINSSEMESWYDSEDAHAAVTDEEMAASHAAYNSTSARLVDAYRALKSAATSTPAVQPLAAIAEQPEEIPISRSTFGSLEECEKEHARRAAKSQDQQGSIRPSAEPAGQHEAIIGAVARGWCAPECASKTMDPALVYAVAREIELIWPAAPVPAPAPLAGWISVKDRMPELHTCVALLNDDRWMNTGGDFDINWHGAGWLCKHYQEYWSVIGETRGMTLDSVTHWMYLPAPQGAENNQGGESA